MAIFLVMDCVNLFPHFVTVIMSKLGNVLDASLTWIYKLENVLIRTASNHQWQAVLCVLQAINQTRIECVQGLIQIAYNQSMIDVKAV